MSQTSKIKEHLNSGKTITAIEALNKYGCFRLAARIYDIRKTMFVKQKLVTYKGKTYAIYHK